MNLSEEYRKLIGDEFEDILRRLSTVKNPADFLYLFSASFGVLNRVMNFECDSTLVFMHHGLHTLHQAVQGRLQASTSSPGELMGVPDVFLKKMADILERLRAAFIDGSVSKIHAVLEDASNLAYATTGNGFYLFLTGKLKV